MPECKWHEKGAIVRPIDVCGGSFSAERKRQIYKKCLSEND
jgi:hypothetical protein